MSDIHKQIASLSPEKQALLSQRLRMQKETATRTLIKRQSRETNIFSTSFAQQRLWFLDQLETGTPYYNICRAFYLDGPLDLGALERSLNEIVQRHEALRTTFKAIDLQPMQVIAPFAPVSLVYIQLESAAEHEIIQLVRTEARTPFDLCQGPLWRATLLGLQEDAHVFIFTMHHIVFDGWSMEILFRELSALYDAYTTGQQSPLPALPIQYVDYACWQREWLQGERLDTQQAYWKRQLSDLPEILALPTDRPRPVRQTFHGALYPFTLSRQVSDNLKELSKREGVTLFMTLLAAFKVLLYRYTGQEDLVVGSPIASRTRAEVEGLIGFFVNTLVLRTRLSADSSFRELLKNVRETTIDAYAHQDFPFEQLVEMLQPTRSLSSSPLYQVLFDLQNAPNSALQLGNVTGRPLDFKREIAKFDLTLFMVDTEQGLQGMLEYNTDLFELATIKRMATHFQVLMEGIVTNPDQQILHLPLLTELECRQILTTWNETSTNYPREQCIHQAFEAQVEQTPNAIAVTFGEDKLTYQELNNQANQLAHYLQQHGISSDVPVGICMERSAAMIIGMLGILKAGGAYVPLDPTYPQERLAYLLQDAQVPVLLTQSHLLAVFPPHYCTIISLDSDRNIIMQQKTTNLSTATIAINLAYIIYTSGSTGQPKGVSVTHQNVIRLVKNTNYITFAQKDVFLHFASISFDASTFEVWGSLLNGAQLVIFPSQVPSLEELAHYLQRYHISTLWLTAGLFHQMVEYHAQALSQVRYLLAGGDVLSVSHTRHMLEVFAGKGVLINGYGPTENTTFTCCYPMTIPDEVGGSVSIGKPIANTTVYVLDTHMQPVPIGVPGDLYIGGDGLARGYLNRPDLTAERFVPHPFANEPGMRLYKTGDFVRFLPDGSITFIGRIDSQVKLRGFRIELGEIEEVLNQHPAVQENVVQLQEDVPGDKRLVAYVVLRTEPIAIANTLRIFLQERLPEYMIPAQIVFLEQLLLTSNGKVDRDALPLPAWDRSFLKEAFVAPRNAIEEGIARIWSEILGLEKAGIHDNFFELGGHSLRATKVISRIRTVLQIDLSVRDLFENPTIALLAEHIEIARKDIQAHKIPPFQKVSRDTLHPLSFTQERLWFMDQLEPGGSTYNIPCAIRLAGSLNTHALETSLQEIVDRHESFRTTFAARGNVPVQIIVSHIDLPLVITDISDLPASARAQKSQQLTDREAQQPFDLKHGPLIRVHLLREAFDEHILLVTTHHIVADGWSMDIFLRELALLYEAFCNGQPSPLPALPFQYVDYTLWQREWLQGDVLETQLTYWKHYLAGAPTALEQLTSYPGRPRPVVPKYRGAWHFFTLPDNLVARVRYVSQQEDATVFMLLLAAFETLLYRYTGQNDFLLGTPIASRTHTEIEDLVGFFTNMLVLRAHLADNPDFRELLRRTREATLGAYAHQDLPFARLVETMQPKRDPSRNPLFQVMFIFNNDGLRHMPQFSDLTMSVLQVSNGTEKFDVTLSLIEAEEGLQGALEYNTDLFEARAIANMAGHFQTLLENIVAHPARRVSDLSLLTDIELHHLLVNQYPDKAEVPQQCLHELFEAQAARTPDALALIHQEDRLTYKELNSQANQLARYLRRHGVGPEMFVGLCMPQGLELVVGILGILKAGGVVVPLDPSSSPEQLASMLDDTAVSLVITQQHLLSKLFQRRVEGILLDSEYETLRRESSDNQTSISFPENVACIRYTSGSTGKPKSVLLSQQSLVHYSTTIARSYDLRAADRVLSFASIDSSVEEIFPILLSGATAVLSRYEEVMAHTDLLARIERDTLTVLTLSAAYWHRWVEELSHSQPSVPPSLRLVAVSGEKVASGRFSAWRKWAGETVQWRNTYGLTEATIASTFYKPEETEIDEKAPTIPLGQPLSNTQLYVLDAHLQLVPVGVPGELYIGGTGLARGYHHHPELTAACFIPNLFGTEPGTRLYRTGDRVRSLPDGTLEFLGRITSQVKIGGFHIQPDEIEAVLMELPEVQEAVVVPWENSRGAQCLAAYITPRPQQMLGLSKLRSQLRTLLPEYMVPTHLRVLEVIPRTPRGKVFYHALPSPEEESSDTPGMSSMPYSALERSIAQIWQEVLHLEKVGVHDNFFDLGGHSLLLLQVHDRLSVSLNQPIPVVDLFNYPTVSALVEYISSQQQHKDETTFTGQNRASARKEAMERRKKAKARP